MKNLANNSIAQLFDNFAQSLPQQQHLCSAAAQQMRSAPVTAKPALPKFSIAAVCACVLVVVLLAVVVAGQFNQPMLATVYAASEVSGQTTQAQQAQQLLPLQQLSQHYTICSQRFRTYYFKQDNSFAYIAAAIGVETEFGVVELYVIAEREDVVLEKRHKTYTNCIYGKTYTLFEGNSSDRGEYVTRAYFAANGNNYYIVTQSNQSNLQTSANLVQLFLQLQGN